MTALDQAEAALLTALAAVRAARGDAPEPADAARRMLPLKLAAHALGISKKTVYRRVQAGAGWKTTKGWIVDLQAAAEMGRRGL